MTSLTLIMAILLGGCSETKTDEYLSPYFVLREMTNNQFTLSSEFIHENMLTFENSEQIVHYLFAAPVYVKSESNSDSYNLSNNTPLSSNNTSYKYTNTYNDIKTFLPNRLSADSSILIKHNRNTLSIIPQASNSKDGKIKSCTNIYGKQGDCIQYTDTFGKNDFNVFIEDFGINTELVRKNDQSTFEYILNIENITIDRSCPDYFLMKDVKSEEVKAVIYKPVISYEGRSLTGMDMKSDCDMKIMKTGDTTYQLTITLSENILRNATSPIKINQSFHLYKPKQPDSAIYSKSNKGYYLQDKVILGNNTDKGEGRLLIRFEALDMMDIPVENIISAEYMATEISGTNTPATIAMYPVLSEWCSLNVRWSSKPDLAAEHIQKVTVDKSGNYSFDITEPLKLWLKNRGGETEYIIRHGFTLINETPENPKIFATGDNGMFTSCLKITLKK